MGLFEYKDEVAAEMHRDLIRLTDGTEPCYDPYLVDKRNPERIYESPADKFVENYTNRGITSAEAQEMCEGCHVLEECGIYALYNEEPNGVWGGLSPRDRGFYKGKKIK